MSYAFTVFFCLIGSVYRSAQVINIESRRYAMRNDEVTGAVSLEQAATKNIVMIIQLGAEAGLRYRHNSHNFSFFGEYNSKTSDRTPLVNNGFAHLRYGYDSRTLITWEGFIQIQCNEIQLVESRLLYGTGPRFRLWDDSLFTCFFGPMTMLEYERSTVESEPMRQDRRNSTFLSTRRAFQSRICHLLSTDL